MPTPRKNRPSRMPRNGSMSASSWWRKVDSDSSTPARKAPIAIDSPPSCMTSAAPSTTSSAAAVITSRACGGREHAEHRVEQPAAGRDQRRRSRRAPMPMLEPARSAGSCSAPPGARKRDDRQQRHDRQVLEQQDRDDALALRRRGLAALVEHLHDDRGRGQHEAHAGDEGDRERQARQPCRRRVSSAPQATTCAAPSPKISRRRLHSRDGCISSPMTNRNMTTPSSATCRIASGSENSRARTAR